MLYLLSNIFFYIILIRLLSAGPRSTTTPLIIPLSVSLRNDLADPVVNGVGLAGFTSRANSFLSALVVLYHQGLKNNTRLTRFFNPTKKNSVR